ncbi:MAG: dTMP kinase [Acidobacteria bacterium]|nr:dTMP kinase [Acidobacteriota bacterium]
MTDSRRPGLFLSFEGMDGSGKTTQMRRLIERLRAEGYDLLETAEPGGTPIGLQIRRILLDSANSALASRAELLLYFACRAQNVAEWIRPALREGRIVVSDRFTDSTLAYQGAGRGLDPAAILTLHDLACQEVGPDLTLYLDIDRELGLSRARARNAERAAAAQPDETRIDDEAAEFHDRVRAAYAGLCRQHPERILRIDAAQPIDAVTQDIWSAVERHIAAHSLRKASAHV